MPGQSHSRRTWAVENAEGLGHHLAQWLLVSEEVVLDVATTATARVRELFRGGRRKNNHIDAAAAACVAAAQGEARPVSPEGLTDILAILDERRANLSGSRTRIVNQLHALLRRRLAGGAPTSLTATGATALPRTFRAKSEIDRIRVGLCRDLIADIRRLDDQLSTNEKQMTQALDEHGTRLRDVDGICAVTAASDRSHRTCQPVSDRGGLRELQRFGAGADRQRALHHRDGPDPDARQFRARLFDKKIAEGKKPAAARRALKRHLSDHVWRIMLADERHRRRTDENQPARPLDKQRDFATGIEYPTCRRSKVFKAHSAILGAILDNDPDSAEKAMRDHIVEMAEYLEAQSPEALSKTINWQDMR